MALALNIIFAEDIPKPRTEVVNLPELFSVGNWTVSSENGGHISKISGKPVLFNDIIYQRAFL